MRIPEAEFANDAFYLAFAQKDMAAMDGLWAEKTPVICLHPGWSALVGREDVIDSWRSILGNPKQAPISFYNVSSFQLAEDMVACVCYEVVAGSTMVATNVFVAENGEPRMVLHQSGPCGNPPELEDEESPRIN